jgi:hypothetical protein
MLYRTGCEYPIGTSGANGNHEYGSPKVVDDVHQESSSSLIGEDCGLGLVKKLPGGRLA